MITLIGVLVLLAVLWATVSIVGAFSSPRSLQARERQELERLRILVDDLKQTAWDHRELDSALATIVIDKIRAYERRGRPNLGP
jgi:hypothetical protein